MFLSIWAITARMFSVVGEREASIQSNIGILIYLYWQFYVDSYGRHGVDIF